MVFNFRTASPLVLLSLAAGCYDGGRERVPGRYGDSSGRSSDWSSSGYEHSGEYTKTPTRDQFIGSIYFSTSSSTLSRAAAADLARMVRRMNDRKHSAARVVLVGYADRKRGVEENSELAAERAQRVAIALEKQGIELDRILIDSRTRQGGSASVRMTRPHDGERRVDLFFENGFFSQGNNLYPVLVAFFLLCAFAVAVIIFRRR
jgi:hypothetical protein